MKAGKVLKTFAVSSLLVGAALAGPDPSTTVSTQPNPVIKGNTSGAGEREIYMDYHIYDHHYYSRSSLRGKYPLLIIDSNRRPCRGSYGLSAYCLRNPRFKITEGNLGDLFISSMSTPLVYQDGDFLGYDTRVFMYMIKNRSCVKGVLIHDGGSKSGKLCAGYIAIWYKDDYYIYTIARREFSDFFIFIPDP